GRDGPLVSSGRDRPPPSPGEAAKEDRTMPRNVSARPRRAATPRDARRVRLVVAVGHAPGRGGAPRLPGSGRDRAVVGGGAGLAGGGGGEGGGWGEASRQCRALAPPVLVLSLTLPGQERAAATPALRAALPQLRIVALSERSAENCLVLNPPARRRDPRELEL